MSTLFRELADDNTPCTRYGCSMRDTCAAKLLACDAWIYYVIHGSARAPITVIPVQGKRPNRPEVNDYPVATRDRFEYAEGVGLEDFDTE